MEQPLRYTICSIGKRDYFIASGEILISERAFSLSLVRDVTREMDAVRSLAGACALAGGIVVLLSAAGTWFLTRRSLRPIGALEKGAAEIAAGSFERRIPVQGSDEVAMLSQRFNDMAQAVNEKVCLLSDTAERQRAFINGLSHELKTPVTSIMARAETLLMRDVPHEDRQRSLQRIYDQCAWLERLAAKLLTLTMLEGAVELRPFRVPELFAQVQATVEDALNESGIQLSLDCKMEVLPMDADLLRSALVNLIENARRASARGARIELTAENGIITVKDYGNGIPEEELSRVTEPFYMVDRSRSKKNGGMGLGLALVKRIVEAHRARLEIISEQGAGTCASILFADDDKNITT